MEPPNICLSLLHDRFRRQSSTLRWLLCWRQQRHSVLGTQKKDKEEPVTQLKGPKVDGDMQAAERDCNASPTRYHNI